ncbi:MAG: NAD(P)H-dependent oxidoreductase [Bdellovibrionales bacterium]|nr:NAD(P)H-dependent oxidoreductase [Bdellovibrionales bacterium]
MKTHIVCGSHRANSQGMKVAKYVAAQIEKKGGQASITDLHHNTLPLWDEGMWNDDPKWAPIWGPIEAKLKEADSLIFVTPEYDGMSPAAMKNFFLFIAGGEDTVAHKPALIIAVSASRGGSYPVFELRGSSYKNAKQVYIPEHVLVQEAQKILNDGPSSGPADDYIRKRIDYTLDLLAEYEKCLKPLRASGKINYKDYPNGM